MVFYLIGIGLYDEQVCTARTVASRLSNHSDAPALTVCAWLPQDITLKGLAAVRKSKAIYLEAYTSILAVPRERLEAAWGVKIEVRRERFTPPAFRSGIG